MFGIVVFLLALCAFNGGTMAHTWIEQVRSVNENGQYVGEYGYPRGFKSKFDPGYNSELDSVYLLPPLPQQPPFINAENLLCHPNQRKPIQADKYPRVQTTPGSWLSLRYSENGHVSNPANPGQLDLARRPNGGSVFIFGTTEPIEDEKIADVLRWTKDGSGGDKRGVLLAVNDYDDGRCYEINPLTKERQAAFPNYAEGQAQEGAPGNFPLMCESNVEIPQDAPSGKPYTLYWVWQWPKDPKVDPTFPKGKDEYYTTCLDVDVADSIEQSDNLQFALSQQDSNSMAVKDFRNRKALITDPIEGEVGPVFSDKPTPTGEAPSAPPKTTLVTTSGAPFSNSTMPMPTTGTMAETSGYAIPTITQRPGETTNAAAPPKETDGAVRITVTTRITVTAPVAPAPTGGPAQKKRAEHVAHHSKFKIRGQSNNRA